MKTYKQELDFALKNDVDVYKLKIAYEVYYFMTYSDIVVEYDNETFESICECVNEIYLSLDNNYSLSNIVEAVINLHYECDQPIEDIDKYTIIGYIQQNF